MQFDNLLNLSTSQAVTVTAASTSIYDVTGAGSGNAPNMIGGVLNGVNTVIGSDIGAGDGMAIPEIFWNIATTFVSAGGATLQLQLQAAPDNGSNLPGAYTTLVQTQAFPTADLTANTTGQFQIPMIPPDFGEAMPRFYRLNYVVGSSTFSAGAITANIVINPSNATRIQNYPSNFTA